MELTHFKTLPKPNQAMKHNINNNNNNMYTTTKVDMFDHCHETNKIHLISSPANIHYLESSTPLTNYHSNRHINSSFLFHHQQHPYQSNYSKNDDKIYHQSSSKINQYDSHISINNPINIIENIKINHDVNDYSKKRNNDYSHYLYHRNLGTSSYFNISSCLNSITNHIYGKFLKELQNIEFKGPMDDYSDQQIDQIIHSLPQFINHSIWLSNSKRKIRIFARYQIEKNFEIARFLAPISPNIHPNDTNIIYNRFLNSTIYEEPWVQIARDSSFQPNVDILFYEDHIVYKTNTIIKTGVQIVANFKNITNFIENDLSFVTYPSHITPQTVVIGGGSEYKKYNPNYTTYQYSNQIYDHNKYINDNIITPSIFNSISSSTTSPNIVEHRPNISIENSTITESYFEPQSIISLYPLENQNNMIPCKTTIPYYKQSTLKNEVKDNSIDVNNSPSSTTTTLCNQQNLNKNDHSNNNSINNDNNCIATEDQLKGFSCPHCKRLFSYRSYLEKHLQFSKCVDDGTRKFPCNLCHRSFNKSERLRVHITHVHEQIRPYICNYCSKAFTQSSSLNKHIRHHTGEKPYSCNICGRKFSASSILRTHIRQHTGEKPFKCTTCGRAFSSHASLDSHLKRIHNEKKPK